MLMFTTLLITMQAQTASFAQDRASDTWSDAYLDSLALGWPDNRIENAEALRWKSEEQRRISILQLGDSHVQGDLAARATRNFLVHSLGIIPPARGYTFPFAATRSNEPAEIKSRASGSWVPIVATRMQMPQPLGLAGAALETSSPDAALRMAIVSRPTLSPPPTSISILFAPFQGTPVPLLNGMRPDMLDGEKGIATFRYSTPPTEVTLSFPRDSATQVPFRLMGFLFENEASTLIFHAAGVNGADVQTHLKNKALTFDLLILNPRIILISLGSNDAYNPQFSPEAFRSSLTQLLTLIQSALPEALVIVTTPNDHLLRDGEVNPRVAQAAEVIRNLAIDLGIGLWDFHRIMGGEGSIRSWNEHGLAARDHLHLSPLGYALQGRLLAVALSKLLNQL